MSIPEERYADITRPGSATGGVPAEIRELQRRLDAHIGKGGNAHAIATPEEAGFMSQSDKEKLDTVQNGATQNQTDEYLLSLANATGDLPIAHVDGLQEEIDRISDDSAAQLREDLANDVEGNLGAHLVAFPAPEGEDWSVADLADPDKGAAMVARGVVAVDSIADLLALPAGQRREDLRYLVASYHGGWSAENPYIGPRGGGEFYWDSSASKTEHDGGTVVDPSSPFPSNWADRTQITGWLTAPASGTGCFLRVAEQHGVSVDAFGASSGGVLPDADQFLKALEYVESVKGTLLIPSREYAAKLHVEKGGIRIIAEPGALIRAFDNDQLFYIMASATDVHAENITLNGQRAAMIGSRDTYALHGFDIRGKDITLENVRAEGFRQDSLYIRAPSSANIKINGFYFGDTARNTYSIVQGDDIHLSNGTVYSGGLYDSAYYQGGLYLCDIEPNPGFPPVSDVYHTNVRFLSNNTKPQTSSVQVIGILADAPPVNVYFDKCRFGTGDSLPTTLRIRNAVDGVTRGVYVDDCEFSSLVVANSSTDSPQYVQDSRFSGIRLGASNFLYAGSIGPGTRLEDISSSSAALSISGATSASVWRRNVQNYSDTIYTDQYVKVSDVVERYTKGFSITDASVFTDIVTLGTRTAYKVTVALGDSTTGARACWLETYIVTSGDYAVQGAVIEMVNTPLLGGDAKWKAASGFSTDSRTLQIKPRDPGSNLWVVTIEALGQYSKTNGAVTWLI